MRYIVESDFEHNGLRCVVLFGNLGFRNGYVGVPKENRFFGQDYWHGDLAKVECHGGITFSGDAREGYPVPSEGLWWFGFDCGHALDGIDKKALKKHFPFAPVLPRFGGHTWTRREVEEECRKLADRLEKNCNETP